MVLYSRSQLSFYQAKMCQEYFSAEDLLQNLKNMILIYVDGKDITVSI